MFKNFSSNADLLKMLKKYTFIELLIYLFVVILPIFNIYHIAMILIVFSNFKIPFMKEEIQNKEYIRRKNINHTNSPY